MNKKKTIIMTSIAVVSLVVLLVGATYAYFSANNRASGTTTLEATAEEIGVVTVTNPTSSLYLRLSAVEMTEANQGTNYYATSTNSDGYVYSSTEEYNSIANMKVTGGTTDTKYSCTFKINITKPSTIKSGDMSITFKTDSEIQPTISGVTSDTPIDLYSASSQYTASFTATGEHTSGYDIISTAIRLNNTTSDQIYLAGENLGVTITLSDINCEVSKVEEEVTLAAGLYDESDNMISSWDELIYSGEESYGLSDGDLSVSGYKLVIGDKVTSIGTNALSSCDISVVVIPASVTNIEYNAFNVGTLTAVTVDENNPVYDSRDNSNAIIETSSNKLIVGSSNTIIPDTVTSIGEYAFADNTKLTSIVIPVSITEIGDGAFSGCENLTRIYYAGTQAQWGQIEIGPSTWDNNINVTNVTYNYTG